MLNELAARGPLLSRELEDRSTGGWDSGGWYGNRNVSIMLGILHGRGEVAIVGRRGGQRLWGLAADWYPATEKVSLREAERIIAERRFRARGVDLVKGEWHAHPEALDGPVPDRATLLSPFDRVIYDRDRAEALWGFRYRLEMYVPKAKREYGYYVLPLLVGDEVVGRAEPRFDRKTGTLELLGAWGDTSRLDEALAGLAAWLGASTDPVMDFETRAIHDGQDPDPATGAITTPIYQTSTFVQDAVGEHKGYDYARVANPTRTALQVALASLENADHGVAFSSGLGATTTLMHLVNPGERVVLIADVYGGVYRMTSQIYEPKGYVFDYLEAGEFANLGAHLDERTRLVWLETPSNPLLNIVDIRAAADATKAAGAVLVVDNTFATPYLQNPLDLGADVVMHSTTKYLGGHSDVIGGFVATNDPTIAERLYFLQKSLGAVPGPFDCWLVLRGLKTLALRMQRHSENARAIASWLEQQPAVTGVLYPGLPGHPGHEIAKRQMRDFGGMISFLTETEDEAVELVARTKLFRLAESLGGVESLIEHPARMTHASTADAPFAAPRNLVRLSVGIESVDDLIADLAAALVPARASA